MSIDDPTVQPAATEQPRATSGEPRPDTHSRVRRAVRALDLGTWRAVEGRLVLRVIADQPGPPAGDPAANSPLQRPIGNGLALQVVLPVRDGRPDYGPDTSPPGPPDRSADVCALIPAAGLPHHRWRVDEERVLRCAAGNTRRLVRPVVTTVDVDGFQVLLLTGGTTTSGVAVDVGYFLRAAGAAPSTDRSRRWWSVLSDRAVVVLHSGASNQPPRWRDAMQLVTGLRATTVNPLPPNLFKTSAEPRLEPTDRTRR
ncbi:MAG: hypothetical protein AAF531_18625 [Actinomycetota bacterium]